MNHSDAVLQRPPTAELNNNNDPFQPAMSDREKYEAAEKLRAFVDTPATTVTNRTTCSTPNEEMSRIPPLPLRRAAPLAFTLMGAAFLNTMSIQSMVIALPSIAHDLDIPEQRYQWIVTSYSITFGCFLLLWGKLGDVYGKRIVFLWGGVWVSVTTLATAFCPSEITFDIMRALQGLGAAANVPAAIGILGTTIPPGRVKNYAFAIYAAGAPLGAVIGNLIGGILTQYANWKWIFYLLAILSSLIVLISYFVIPLPTTTPESEERATTQLDWFGAFLVTGGLVAIVFALSEGNSSYHGWEKPHIIVLIILFFLMTAAFIVWEWYLENKTNREPLMRLSIFYSSTFSVSMVVTLFFWASFNNYMIYSTYFYQDFLDLSPIQTTLRFLPTGVAGTLTTIVSGYILGRISGSYILAVGITCTALSSLLMALPIPPNTTYWAYGFPAMVLAVFGADTVFPCLALYTTSSMPMKDQALAGGIFNTVSQVGRAIGLAVATAIDSAMRRSHGNHLGDQSKYHHHHSQHRLGLGEERKEYLLLTALRTAQWVNFTLGIVALVAAIAGLRRIGKVGRA